ncbi:MAG: DmsE family decaheme c-type cytochrome [Elusimicrobia bacterium]|nr:DmsE family decaheme c-type cytochrome [Elusimicrobiota bacterium]
MDTRSCRGIARAGLAFTALCAILASPLSARAEDKAAVKETVPAVVASAPAQGTPEGAKFVGKDACANCHTDKVAEFAKTFHGRKLLSSPKLANACESCHGAGSAHAESGDTSKIVNPKKLDAAATADLCFTCHKDKSVMMWKTSIHNQNGVSCTNCHSVHEGQGRKSLVRGGTDTCLQCHKKQKADMRLMSHHPVLEGKMECVSCHNPHGGIEGNLKADSMEEQCFKCHADKAGPFAFEHPPVADGCTNCHIPHGSVVDKLLKQPMPYLCMGCHKWPHQVRTAGVNPAITVKIIEQRGRCTDCHREIHGSDRKAAFKD